MSVKSRSASLPILGMMLSVMLLVQGCASQHANPSVADSNPSIAAGVPFFYYSDLDEAADWYEKKLGLTKVTGEDWVVIFELTDTSYLGLVNATGGSLQPTENKGALLSIETAELEAWYEKLKDVHGINIIHGIEEGADGMIDEFRMTDPGGYVIEFFRWRSHRAEAKKYAQ